MKWQPCILGSLSVVLAQQHELLSPDGTMKLTFSLSSAGRPTYSLELGNEVVIRPSGMGLDFKIRQSSTGALDNFYEGFALIAQNPIERTEFDETWTPYWGEESEIRDQHTEMLVHLVQITRDEDDNERPRYMNIRFRMFNEGLGFRYEVPYQDNLIYYTVHEERSQFAMAGDHHAWWIAGDYDTQEYNYIYTRLSEIRARFTDAFEDNVSQSPFEGGVQTALQLKTDDGIYINIHEAALVNYSAMHLEIHDEDNDNLYFESHLTPDAVGNKAHLQAPNVLPWRTVIASRDARDILRSRITYNLNEPSTGDFSWVKPIKYMGVWWEMITGHRSWDYTSDAHSIQLHVTDYSQLRPHGRHGANNENVRNYIDFASEHGFDALLVEGWNIGWEDWFDKDKDYVFDFLTPYPDFDVVALREYARSKNIALMMHHETSGSTRNYERHLDRAYQFMVDNGYTSVKSGYVGSILPRGQHHYSQDLVNHYLFAVQKAAEFKICVNAHEAVRPTGLSRTYPNMIGNEAARGQEYQAFSGSPPAHVAILPFTRLLGGPMDYTPGIFRHDLYNWVEGHDPTDDNWRIQSTITSQLALYVTMYSPLQMAADTYQNYQPHVDRAFQFIKDVPVDWHQSVYLEAEPGAYITIARLDKVGKRNWFVGNVHGGKDAGRFSEFTFDFLTEPCYQATLYHDAAGTHYWTNPHAYTITSRIIRPNDRFLQWTAAGGGYAIKLEPCSDVSTTAPPPTTTAPPTAPPPTTTRLTSIPSVTATQMPPMTTDPGSGGANSMLGASLLALAVAQYLI